MSGRVYLVGAGPGAPDLLTVRAAAILARADIVFYDALILPETLALAARAEKFAVGKRSGRHSTAQKFINKRLIDAARHYRTVVRLKGGDPMLFGRAQEEIDALAAAGIEYEVVPGVTAALAAAAELGVSLTRRGLARQVVFVTPRTGAGQRENDWVRSVLAADTAVIYMGAGKAEQIAAALIERGKPAATPVAVIENASLPQRQLRFGTLRELPALGSPAQGGPALIVLGEVLGEALALRASARRSALARHA